VPFKTIEFVFECSTWCQISYVLSTRCYHLFFSTSIYQLCWM